MALRVGRHLSPLTALLAASVGMAEEVPEPLRRCAALDDDARRLACYDRYVAGDGADSMHAERPPAVTPPTDAVRESPALRVPDQAAGEPDPGAHEDAEARFGLPEDDDEDVDEISARIVDIVVRANRERIFTLDNGQVWVEDSPKPSVRLKVGDAVKIRAGVFDSYRLYSPSDRSTAVDRAR